MRKPGLMIALVPAFVLVFALSAAAQCCKGGKADAGQTVQKMSGTPADNCKSGEQKCCEGACPGQVALVTGMPLMKYKYGDQEACCSQQVEKLAAANKDVQVRFVVGDREYSDRNEALAAYEKSLSEYLNQMTTVRYQVGDKCVACPEEAQALAKECGQDVRFRVASFTFADREQAEKAAAAARAAAEKVSMTYVVDGKEYACAHSAEKLAQCEAGGAAKKACTYRVAGKETNCRQTAAVELTKAQIVAAYKVLEEVAGDQGRTTKVTASR